MGSPASTCLQYVQTICLIVLTGFSVLIAYRQMEIAAAKWKHDLYERRYRVFDAMRNLLEEILYNAAASEEGMRSFMLATGDAKFLFDDSLTKYIMEWREHAKQLRSLKETMADAPVDDRNKASASMEANKHLNWLIQQKDGLADKFSSDLSLYK
jgi:hypothetical protein